MMIWEIMVGVVCTIYGLVCFLCAVLKWDGYSQHPKLFPCAGVFRWKVDMYGWLYDAYGDKAVRKCVLMMSLAFVVFGIYLPVAMVRDDAERRQIDSYPQVRQGETFSIAGGELTLEDVGIAEGFMANRFNVDKDRYEEVKVGADMYGEVMLLLKATLTNNGDGTLTVLREDIKFYAKPEEGHNIKGQLAVDGYLDKTGKIELAEGESVPIFFWLSLSKEEQKQNFTMVLQYGGTGCRIGLGNSDT